MLQGLLGTLAKGAAREGRRAAAASCARRVGQIDSGALASPTERAASSGSGDAPPFPSRGYRVLAFGQGNSGALGLGDLLDAHEPALVEGLPDDVTSIACGHFHSVAVTASGEVWTWGRNQEKQLGHDGKSDFNPLVCDVPGRVGGGEMEGTRIRDASASGVASFAVCENGRAFSWGTSKRGQLGLGPGVVASEAPRAIPSRLPFKKISAGWGHAVGIADTNVCELLSWGYPVQGRLGYGYSEIQQQQQSAISGASGANGGATMNAEDEETAAACVWQPREVARLSGMKILGIACGADHTVVTTEWGAVFAFGDNSMMQLGIGGSLESHATDFSLLGSEMLHLSEEYAGGGSLQRTDSSGLLTAAASEDIQRVLFPVPVRATAIASGYAHTLCLAKRADVSDENFGELSCLLSWGWDSAHQLGQNTGSFEGIRGDQPAFVRCFEGGGIASGGKPTEGSSEEDSPRFEAAKIAAGRVHSVVLTQDGEVLAWGDAKNGRLGFDPTAGATGVPQKVLFPEDLGVKRVIDIACGYDHTLLLVE